ncbi:MAG: cytidine deaminase [Bacteroidales bacterium]|nr:cytidine deaminase [Bacteroidales bacterium]
MDIDNSYWEQMAAEAWKARDNAYILDNTKVGAALITPDKTIISGCNVEHQMKSHDMHAETNAIGNMVVQGYTSFDAIVVVAETTMFTPCGSCMDWIIQFGGKDVVVGVQNKKGGEIRKFRAGELMPYYPEY